MCNRAAGKLDAVAPHSSGRKLRLSGTISIPMKRVLPKPRDDSDLQVLRDVAGNGCHIVGVLADESGPAFVYSIGLFHNYGHPEIVLFGLSHELMSQLINDMRDKIQHGSRFNPGSKCSDLVEGFDCEFLAVHPSYYQELFGYARWFYVGDNFPVIQCVWPDRKGCFPWQRDFDPKFKDLQPTYDKIA